MQLLGRKLRQISAGHPLAGKKVWIPRMSSGSVRTFAAAFRSIGIEAEQIPPSDERTRELGARHTCGDECYPTKITLGDFLKLLEKPETDAARTVFFLPSSKGPCRFGQYAPHLRHVLDSLGYRETGIISPDDRQGYSDIGELASLFVRTGWRALVAADLLLKYLLRTRPYETQRGDADTAYETGIGDICEAVQAPYETPAEQMQSLSRALVCARDRFRSVPVRFDPERPLVGIVGEIYCRLSTFSNNDIVRRLEDAGGEAWMSDISEWVWYTNDEQARHLRREGHRYSKRMLGARLRWHVQQKDEGTLRSVFAEDFRGYEEPEHIAEVVRFAEPYLPAEGATGEMVVNVGRCVYLARKGADGVLDISPFTCMNGIVGEAIYPRLSRDLSGMPIRTFYFDGTQSDLERDLSIYLELARSYRKRKPWPRTLPRSFAAA